MVLAKVHPLDWTWKIAVCTVLLCAAIETYTLADRSRGEPRNRDIRRYVLGEIYDAHRVEQRFLVKANGFSSITIHPRPASTSPTGTVVLELRDVTDGPEGGAVKRISTPLVALTQAESLTMRFPPQPSLDRDYVLKVSVEGSSDGQGIGLLASRGEGYRGTILQIDGGQARWGDLIFETTVDKATSNFGSIASQLAQGGVLAPRVVLLVVLLGKYAALFLVIRACARPLDAATRAGQTPPSQPA